MNAVLLASDAATLLKTEAGSLPEGKVKIRLESDGSLLDVDEDDVEKVFSHCKSSEVQARTQPCRLSFIPGEPADVGPSGRPGLPAVPKRVERDALPAAALRQ